MRTALAEATAHRPVPDVAPIRIGLAGSHGMAKEVARSRAEGVAYSFLTPGQYETADVDLIEAVLNPIRTSNRWLYSLAHIAEACGLYEDCATVPANRRVEYLTDLLTSKNLKKLVFWSHAGHETLSTYGGIDPSAYADNIAVVYPAVRRVPDHLIEYRTRDLQILFAGDFFRKGGVHVVDAFARARQRYPGISLTVCCDESLDFNTPNRALRTEYLNKLHSLPGIVNKGRLDREALMTEVYPQTDIFVIPTYVETFGMAILEAMAFGIPVISTNHFAIPEMIEDGVSGALIDTRPFNCEQLFRGYTVRDIPADFRDDMTAAVFNQLCRLIESVELRKSIGQGALDAARTKFSFARRNQAMREIYREALVK